MMWLIFLATVFINGLLLHDYIFPSYKKSIRLIGSFIYGSVLVLAAIYLLASYIFQSLQQPLLIYFLFVIVVYGYVFIYKKYTFSVFSLERTELIIIFSSFIFSWILFNKAFTYDQISHEFLIASNVYLDMGAHTPFIRSFSFGNNLPFEIPFFAGGNIPYHFMMDFYAGILEYLGLRIDLALNLVSSIALASFLLLLYRFSFDVLKSRVSGIIAIILFLFPSNLSFIDYFHKNGFAISSVWHNMFYHLGGPLGSQTISVFWFFNTFLNQRQLLMAILVVLYIIYLVITLSSAKKYTCVNIIMLGILVGLLPFWHSQLFLGLVIILAGFICILQNKRALLLLLTIAILVALPQLLIIAGGTSHLISVQPGFVLQGHILSSASLSYWTWNLGLLPIVVFFGFLSMKRDIRNIFIVTMILFLIPNIFQLSKDPFDDHKFLNLWIVFGCLLAAQGIVYLYMKGLMSKVLVIVLFPFLIISGVINNMVIKNDVHASIQDASAKKLMSWALTHIEDDGIILTNGEIYDPMSLIGKRTFLGRSHYIYLYGANPQQRIIDRERMLMSNDMAILQSLLRKYTIRYVVLYKGEFVKNRSPVDMSIFKANYKIIYEDDDGIIFKV